MPRATGSTAARRPGSSVSSTATWRSRSCRWTAFPVAAPAARLLGAAREVGASPFPAFRLVTLPLSAPAILAGVVIMALPMFGDYYTPDLLSGAPQPSLIGNEINLYIRGGQQVPVGAALVVVLMVFLTVLMSYYLYATPRAQRGPGGGPGARPGA